MSATKRQFIIVNNGTTEIRGHYFETAISVAEAARRAGFVPRLALHVDCPIEGIPAWLDCLPLFRVDHWAQRVYFDPAPAVSTSPIKPTLLKRLAKRLAPSWIGPWMHEEIRIHRRLAERMSSPETNHDLACSALFQSDFARLLDRLGAGPGDHIFLPTAHFREAYAIRRLIHERGERAVPHCHLEFRHGIVSANQGDFEVPPPIRQSSQLGEWFFDAIREYPETDRLRYYTDTDELAADYRQLCRVPFGVLPIPFTHDLIPNSSAPGSIPYTCAYVGDVRSEKGFQLLPGLFRALKNDLVDTGKLRFLLQGTTIHLSGSTPELVRAMEEMSSHPAGQVDWVGRGQNFVQRDEYYRLLTRADIVLCPYQAGVYRARSSGILTEAIAAGKPVIVPANTWLANQLPAGCGESFTDEKSLAEALRKICTHYDSYHARLQGAREGWLAKHSPAALLNRLVARKPKRPRHLLF